MTAIIDAIPSKSIYHRASICSFIKSIQGNGYCTPVWTYKNYIFSKDMEATKESLDRLEALYIARSKALAAGRQIPDYAPVLDVGESGATLRFLLPLVGVLGIDSEFRCRESLMRRPIESLTRVLTSHGCNYFINSEEKIIRASGSLKSGEFRINGSESSQYASGILMALPLLEGDSTLYIEKPIVSRSYIDMTLKVLNDFGVSILKVEDNEEYLKYLIPGNQLFLGPDKYTVEGDWSNGAFWIAAEQLSGTPLLIKGLNAVSEHPDRKIVDYVQLLKKPGKVVIDGSKSPDIVPIIAVLAMNRKGETVIENVEFIRMKESDRVAGIIHIIQGAGGKCQYDDGTLRIFGADIVSDDLSDDLADCLDADNEEQRLEASNTEINADSDKVTDDKPEEFIYIATKDHRMVMMASLVSIITPVPVILEGWRNIAKSDPSFFRQLTDAGLDKNLGRA